MRLLLEFYQPYVSDYMPKRWQYVEMISPLLFALLCAIGASSPLAYNNYWLGFTLSVAFGTFFLYTAQAGLLWLHAERRPGGRMYISPSVDTSIRGGVFLFSLLYAALNFYLWVAVLPN